MSRNKDKSSGNPVADQRISRWQNPLNRSFRFLSIVCIILIIKVLSLSMKVDSLIEKNNHREFVENAEFIKNNFHVYNLTPYQDIKSDNIAFENIYYDDLNNHFRIGEYSVDYLYDESLNITSTYDEREYSNSNTVGLREYSDLNEVIYFIEEFVTGIDGIVNTHITDKYDCRLKSFNKTVVIYYKSVAGNSEKELIIESDPFTNITLQCYNTDNSFIIK